MLFLPALSAACGLEAQEEIFPGNKFRYTELRLDGTLPATALRTPLYLFRRAARTQDGYVFDRSYTSVADGETLKLPLAELKAYDYRFLMVAQPGDAQRLSLSTAAGTQFVPGVAWEDLRLGCASGAAAPDGYSGYTDLSGEAILLDGKIRLTLTRVAGQVLFDIYRTGGSLSQPESILSPDVESVIDRIARIEISYENPTTELRFDENGTLVPAAYASEPLVQSILPQMTDFKVPLPQTDKGLGIYDDGVRGSLRMKGAFLLPSDSKLRVKLLFTYYDTTPACGNGHTNVHSAACFPQRQLTLALPAADAATGLPVAAGTLHGQPGGAALRPDHRHSGRRGHRNEFRLVVKRQKRTIMRKLSVLFVMAAFLTGGCSEGESFGHPSAEREKRVEVSFRLETVGTDVSLVPMTRATSYTQWFRNTARLLILKKADTRWIVDTTQTVLLDAQSGPWAELKIAGDLPPCPFNLELRPGDYRIVAVINWGSADWNNDLIPGKVVSDETDGSLRTPPLLTYTISTHWMNNGYRQLSREVFVAVADFPVPKSGDLHSAGVPPVTLRAERRVAKFRVLLKDKPSPVNGFSFDMTAHTVQMLFTSKTEPFAEGIDALGGMYYGDPALYELPCCMSTMGDFHSSGTERYQMCQTNSTVFSPFVFADPASELPIGIVDIDISGASGGYTYKTDQTFARTLAASKISGIVFETTDTYDDSSSQIRIDVVEATDDAGNPENAAALFDSFFEWNASPY